jgi:hypothetical protein
VVILTILGIPGIPSIWILHIPLQMAAEIQNVECNVFILGVDDAIKKTKVF